MKFRRVLPVLLSVAFLLLLATVAEACPGCKDSLVETDPTKAGIVKGYFYSILFMMGMPYTVLSIFIGTMYYKVRKLRAAERAAERAGKALDATDNSTASADRAELPDAKLEIATRQREPVEV